MVLAAKRALRTVEDAGESASQALLRQVAAMRQEIAAISDAMGEHGAHHLDGARHDFAAMARDMRHHGAVVARQVTRQAGVAGRVVHDNPLPAIVALGTIALLSALIFARD